MWLKDVSILQCILADLCPICNISNFFFLYSQTIAPRQCCVCGKLARLECKECYGSLQFGAGLETTSFCRACLEKVHSHDRRTNHTPHELKIPHDFLIMSEHITVPRIFMELFAVVCIETSHYVAFVKCGSGADAPWCFFDSMADRKGTSPVAKLQRFSHFAPIFFLQLKLI